MVTQTGIAEGTSAKQPRTGVLKRVRSWLSGYRDENPQSYVAAKRAAGLVLIADALFGLENPLDGRRTRPGIWGRAMMLLPVLMFGAIWFGAVTFMMQAADGNTLLPRYESVAEGTVVSVTHPSSNTTSTACDIRYEFTPEGADAPRTGGPGYSSTNFCDLAEGDTITVEYNAAEPWRSTIPNVFDDLGGSGMESFLSLFRLAPLIFILPMLGQVIGIVVDVAQIVIGAVLLRSASKDAKRLLPDGFDFQVLVDEMREQLVPLVMTVKSGMKGAKRMFRGPGLSFSAAPMPDAGSPDEGGSPALAPTPPAAPASSVPPAPPATQATVPFSSGLGALARKGDASAERSSLEDDMVEYEEFRRWREAKDRDA